MSELCVWDLDGTLRPGFLMGDAIAHAADMGLVDISVFANPSAPDYQELHHFMAAVTAQPRNVFGNLMDRLSEEATTQIYPWAHERIETQVKEGLHPIIVSQSPAFLVKAFARGITGVQHARGSYLETKELKFTGKASSLDKMRAALRYAYEHGLPREFA
jgi:phosphoserine phosphatase